MNTVSVKIADELLKASNWLDTDDQLVKYSLKEEPILLPMPKGDLDIAVMAGSVEWKLPAYTLGYLLRNLPRYTNVYYGDNDSAYALSDLHAGFKQQLCIKHKYPEDALALLAIELFKLGVLHVRSKNH